MSSSLNVPEPVARVAAVMSTYSHAWALCGGWAVDSWLGRVTREHADLDIAVFESDQRALLEHLAEWNLIAHDEDEPQAIEPWTGRPLVLPAHLHAREPGLENAALVRQWVTPPYTQAKDGRDFEFIVNPGAGAEWVFSGDPRIALPVAVCVRESSWGLPALVPEAIAFYKATAYFGHPKLWARPHDVSDFEALVPLLDSDRRAWLRHSIATLHPEHPWLPNL